MQTIVRNRRFDVLITTYEQAKICIMGLSRINFEVMIVDEAHKIKNTNTMVFQALLCYKASFKLLLTGTPLSNNLQELWSLMYFIMPDIFDD